MGALCCSFFCVINGFVVFAPLAHKLAQLVDDHALTALGVEIVPVLPAVAGAVLNGFAHLVD